MGVDVSGALIAAAVTESETIVVSVVGLKIVVVSNPRFERIQLCILQVKA